MELNETLQANPIEASVPQPDEVNKAQEDKKNTLYGIVFLVLIVVAVIYIISSWLFGSGIEIDYGDFENTDEVKLSDFSADYNEDIGYLTIEGTIKSKVDCYECIIVYFEVYNEYDRVVTICRIETDALEEGEKYTFDDMYDIESGSDIEKIKIIDVTVF